MKNYSWLIRREFWENRAIWMIPAVFGALLIFGACVGRIDIMAVNPGLESRVVGRMFLVVVGLAFFLLMSLYSAFYLLDSLYADRKDRSILFWKSLPISDTQTVLSKLIVGVIVIPLVYFAIADLTSLLLAFVISIRAHALIGSTLWQGDVWLQIQALWIYIIVTTAIWYLPTAGWLLLVSAYAKRAVMLWSVLPPLVLYVMERWFLGSHVIASLISEQFHGYGPVAFHRSGAGLWANGMVDDGPLTAPVDTVWSAINAVGFFGNYQTWIGAAVGIALILGAIQLRMRRTES